MSKSILPPSASFHEIALEMAHAQRIESLPVPLRVIRRPYESPVAFLPWLAWDNGVTWWDVTWSEQQQRNVIAGAREVNRRRGTAGAVRRALAGLDYPTDIIEWFDDSPVADPYTFRIVLHVTATEDDILKARDVVMDAKNVRSYLSGISVNPPQTGGEYFLGAVVTAEIKVTVGVKM